MEREATNGFTIIIDIFLNLTLPFSRGRFIDGHLDSFLVVGHHNGSESTVLRVQLAVLHRPEAMPHQVLLVVLHDGHHLEVGLISNNVVDEQKVWFVEVVVQRIGFF